MTEEYFEQMLHDQGDEPDPLTEQDLNEMYEALRPLQEPRNVGFDSDFGE